MIRDFFVDKFTYDLACNKAWIRTCVEHEDLLSDNILRSFSHLLNVHHRWLCTLFGSEPESDLNDVFDPVHWEALAVDNFRQSLLFLEHDDYTGIVEYYSQSGEPIEKEALDILYHILNHSNYHRAQIAVYMREVGIQPPSFNFISFH